MLEGKSNLIIEKVFFLSLLTVNQYMDIMKVFTKTRRKEIRSKIHDRKLKFDFFHLVPARTMEVSIWRSGMVQYFLSKWFFSSVETSR